MVLAGSADPYQRIGLGQTPLGSGFDLNLRSIRLHGSSTVRARRGHPDRRPGLSGHFILDIETTSGYRASDIQHRRPGSVTLVLGALVLLHRRRPTTGRTTTEP